ALHTSTLMISPAVPALPSLRVGSCTVTTISSCVRADLADAPLGADGQGNMRSTGSTESPLRRLIPGRVMDRHPQNPQNRVLRVLRVATSPVGAAYCAARWT